MLLTNKQTTTENITSLTEVVSDKSAQLPNQPIASGSASAYRGFNKQT